MVESAASAEAERASLAASSAAAAEAAGSEAASAAAARVAALEAEVSASSAALSELQRQHERATVEKALVLEGQKASAEGKAELETRLESLSSENTRLRAEFDARIRELESDYQSKAEELKGTHALAERSLSERVSLLEEQKAALIAQNASEMVELEERFKRKVETDSDRSARQEKISKLTAEKDSLLSRLEEATQHSKEAQNTIDQLAKEKKTIADQLEVSIVYGFVNWIGTLLNFLSSPSQWNWN